MSIKNLYAQELQEHYRHPKNKGELKNPDFSSRQYNPTCGDTISVQGKIKDSIVTDLMFDGEGCVISQATASMLTEHCKGMTVDEILSLDNGFVTNLIKMELGPARLKCAVLSFRALQEGLAQEKDA